MKFKLEMRLPREASTADLATALSEITDKIEDDALALLDVPLRSAHGGPLDGPVRHRTAGGASATYRVERGWGD